MSPNIAELATHVQYEWYTYVENSAMRIRKADETGFNKKAMRTVTREALCAVVDKRLNRIEYRYDSHTMIEITDLYTIRMRVVRGLRSGKGRLANTVTMCLYLPPSSYYELRSYA